MNYSKNKFNFRKRDATKHLKLNNLNLSEVNLFEK